MMARITFIIVLDCVLIACLSEYESKSRLSSVVVAGDLPRDKRANEYFVDPSQWPNNGVPGDVNVYPSYEERAMATWINVVCSFVSILHIVL